MVKKLDSENRLLNYGLKPLLFRQSFKAELCQHTSQHH